MVLEIMEEKIVTMLRRMRDAKIIVMLFLIQTCETVCHLEASIDI